MNLNLDTEITELNAHIASISFGRDNGELKAQLLIAKAGLLQAEAIRQQDETLSHIDIVLQAIATALGA